MQFCDQLNSHHIQYNLYKDRVIENRAYKNSRHSVFVADGQQMVSGKECVEVPS
jgi:hypothetical protein